MTALFTATRQRSFYGQAIIAALAICVAGCDRHGAKPDRESGLIVTPAANMQGPSPTLRVAISPAVTASPGEGESVFHRVDPRTFPTATVVAAKPVGPLPTRKDFADPPLPAELRNDGGLAPLTPPIRTTDR